MRFKLSCEAKVEDDTYDVKIELIIASLVHTSNIFP